MLNRIFPNRNIFRLWSAQVISESGNSMFMIALMWLMLHLTGSGRATGIVTMCVFLPALLFGLFTGALADRFNKRKIMLTADLCRAAIGLTIPVLYGMDLLTPLLLASLAFTLASFDTLYLPARDALVARLATPDERVVANTLIHTSWHFAILFGPAFAAVFIPRIGLVQLFNVDAITFLVSFWFILRISIAPPAVVPAREPLRAELRATLRSLGEAFAYLRAHRKLMFFVVITTLYNIFIMGPAVLGKPLFIERALGMDENAYAAAEMWHAGGLLTGAFCIYRFGRRIDPTTLLLLGVFFDGVTFVPVLWADNWYAFTGLMILNGFFTPMVIVGRPTLLQAIIPEPLQGRIFSMAYVAVIGGTAMAVPLTGWLADQIPIAQVFALMGALSALCAVVAWITDMMPRVTS